MASPERYPDTILTYNASYLCIFFFRSCFSHIAIIEKLTQLCLHSIIILERIWKIIPAACALPLCGKHFPSAL